jgi:Tol biopolymer transport system component
VVSPVPSSAVVTVAWAGDRVLFTGSVSGHRAILSVRPDGGIPQEVVAQGGKPTATSDGRTIVFAPTDPARAGLWKVTDGGRAVQLTPVTGGWPSVTRDDRHVVYTAQVAGIQSLWMVSIDGGTPTELTNRFVASPTLSPDGKTVAFFSADAQNQNVLMICDLSECMSPRSMAFPVSPIAMQKFTPDGLGIMYVTGTPPNLWVQPLDGTPARQFTHFTDDHTIADSAWSHDGRHLAIARTTTSNDIVLFKGLKR